MQEGKNPKTIPEQTFTVFDVWERLGITDHMGGTYATRRLIESCNITPGQYVLDIGCGTGYTACLLAKEHEANVVAADISSKVLEWAKKRIAKEGVSDKVKTVEADAEKLTFPTDTFDAAIAESVLVHCDGKKAVSEVYRVLRHGGLFGDNEVTYLKPPPAQLIAQLSGSLFGGNIRALQEHEWRAVLKEAGFVDICSAVHKIDLLEPFLSHLRVDGVRRYFTAVGRGISDPAMRGAFFKKEMLRAWRQYSSYVGYGLYVGRKV